MADNRYIHNSTIHKSTLPPTPRQQTRQWAEANNPLNWGWTLTQSSAKGRIYEQGDLTLVWVLDLGCWLVGHQMATRIEGRYYHGTAKQLTALLWAMGLPVGPSDWAMSAAATEQRQAEWEAAHLVDDYALEAAA